ncbi:DUF2147 domain-containing protein [Oleiagrimonas sp. C23AA]|uniref:DUF2147 domain-containing protein n=1 Tax=Oleiagrimonas sp. C23AA TaxID=2719047 RepID=UPI001421F4DC|nr:DUF2147 domain-containing protein [Oleiagrimonas sp. C23AA]NII10106.1 DUF2147 domain-containing protein [Oleiagrimonas sp. C23AA]
MKPFRRLLVSLALLLAIAPLAAVAQSDAAPGDSPVGTWKTIDDDTGKAKALVQITENNGVLSGKVIKVLQSEQGPNPRCTKCDGERHNQPVEGMTILWGLTRDGDEWTGGKILDPKKGSTYKCKMRLMDGGQKLRVRGFIGFSLLGRTQIWVREK